LIKRNQFSLNYFSLFPGSIDIPKSKDSVDGLIVTKVDGGDTLINFDNENELSSSSFSSSYSGDLLHFQNASDDLI
jgi:hypothetical protein